MTIIFIRNEEPLSWTFKNVYKFEDIGIYIPNKPEYKVYMNGEPNTPRYIRKDTVIEIKILKD